MHNFPPKRPWDDLRREVEKVLGLPWGSTDPSQRLPSPLDFTRKLIVKLEDLLRRRN